MKFEELYKYIRKHETIIIGIDGPSGSGKSTLAKKIEDEFDCIIFHTDDYFLHPDRKTEQRLAEPGGYLDYERMEQEIFYNLHKPHIQSNHFNCMTNQLETRSPQVNKKIIIVEGVYSMHPKFINYYDFKVFLSIDRETQKSRILARSNEFMLNRFITEWIPLEDKYFSFYNVKNLVDMIIEN